VSVVVVEAGTEPPAPGAVVALPVALGAGQAIPDAAGVVELVELGVGEPPQAVAKRATPMLSAVSLATRGAA
jgi:hypothetical protein